MLPIRILNLVSREALRGTARLCGRRCLSTTRILRQHVESVGLSVGPGGGPGSRKDTSQISIESQIPKSALSFMNPSPSVEVLIDGQEVSFDPVFLRDSCCCEQCMHPTSGQKLFETAHINPGIEVESLRRDKDYSGEDLLYITWKNDLLAVMPHTSQIPIRILRAVARHLRGDFGGSRKALSTRPWNSEIARMEIPWIEYGSFMNDDSVLLKALGYLHTHGLVFLQGIPDNEMALENHISPRIGPLKRTFYGDTWDVRSVPDAKNIAYTSKYLGLHMDLLYTSNPPHLQFLHSLRAQASGGESLFADGLQAALDIQRTEPNLYETLKSFPVTYHYDRDGHMYKYTRPVIEVIPSVPELSSGATLKSNEERDHISRINWSPPFQHPIEHGLGLHKNSLSLRKFLAAAKVFSSIVNDDLNVFEHRLNEGECVIFDNRRVLHARRQFDTQTGERWLKGCYIDDDVFKSKLQALDRASPGVLGDISSVSN